MIKRLTVSLLALTIAVAVVVSGCGGGSDSNTASGADSAEAVKPIATSSLSKAQFVAKANARCAARKREIWSELRAFGLDYAAKHPNAVAAGEVYPGAIDAVAIPGIQDQIAEVRELGAPAGEEAKVEAILVALEEGIEAAKKQQPVKTSTQFIQGFTRSGAGDRARKYGLAACAYG